MNRSTNIFNSFGAFNLKKAFMLRMPLVILLFVQQIAHADIGVVKINEKTINQAVFEANYLVNQSSIDFCAPDGELFVLETVTDLVLIAEAGREEKLAISPEWKEAIDGTNKKLSKLSSDTGSYDYKYTLNNLVYQHASAYEELLIDEVADEDIQNRYDDMLKNNHPMIVNSIWFRGADLLLKNPEIVKKAQLRIEEGDDFEGIGADLNNGQNYSRNVKEKWRHVYVFPKKAQSQAHKVGDIVGPYRMRASWVFTKILETETRPVSLLDDSVHLGYSTISVLITQQIKEERRQRLLDELRANNVITIDGKPAPEPSSSQYCWRARV